MAARSASMIALSVFAALGQLRAQTGSPAGMVYRDSLAHEIAGAEISMPGLQRRVTANYLGAFRLMELPPGKHLVQIRAVGFSPYRDSVVITAGKETLLDFI